jgi:hypothetical protein
MINWIARPERHSESNRRCVDSASCQPAFVGSLPTKIVFGRLPNKLPALPKERTGVYNSSAICTAFSAAPFSN